MMKRKIINSLLIICSIAVGVFFSKKLSNQFFTSPDIAVFSLVPTDASIIFEFNTISDFRKTVSTKKYVAELQHIGLFQKLTQDFILFDSLFNKDEASRNLFLESQILTTVQSISASQVAFLHIVKQSNEGVTFQKLVEDWQKIGYAASEYIYEGYVITELETASEEKVAICVVDKSILLSKSNVLIEKSIAELKTPKGNLSQQKDLIKVRSKTGKNADCSVYINLETLPFLASNFTNKHQTEAIDQISKWGSWVGLDFSLLEDGFILNGYFAPNRRNQFFNSLKKEAIIDSSDIERILPVNTAYSFSVSSKDFRQFVKQKKHNDQHFDSYFLSWMGKTLTYVVTEPLTTDIENNQFWVAEVANYDLAVKQLEALANENGALPTETIPPYTLKSFLANDLFTTLIGKDFNPIRNPYYAFIDKKYVVFANNAQALEPFLEQMNFNQTLAQNINYQQFKSKDTQVSSINQYVNLSNCFHLLSAFLKEEVKEKWAKDFQYFEKIKPITIRLTPYNDLQVVNIRAVFDEKGKQATSVIWRSELESKAIIPPTIVKNHYTGENEIFVQDSNFRIYLLNKNGKKLWSKQLEGKILSEVSQIDFYQNNRLQYLFNTSTSIHLIDRNGNDVKAFPRKLGVEATNGLTMFKHRDNQSNLIFLAGRDSCIYGFNKDGSPLKNWNPGYKVGHLTKPIHQITVKDRHYFAALNTAGFLHIIQEDGNPKIQPIDFEIGNKTFLSDIEIERGKSSARVIAVDSKGKGHVVNLDGKKFNLNMSVGKNKKVRFCHADIVGDNRKDYILLSGNDLMIYYYDENNKYQPSHKVSFLNRQEDLFPIKLPDYPKAFIGTVSTDNNEISLFDSDAKLIRDFPLAGSTRFTITDLYEDGKKILIVANENLIYTYRLSYIIN